MGGKSQTSKTEQTNSPPKWAEPLFKQSASEASKLYNQGVGGNPYLGSTVAPMSGTSVGGLNQLIDAGANWNTGGTRDLYGQIGGAAVSNPYISQMGNMAGQLTQTGRTDTRGLTPQNVGVAQYNPAIQQTNAIGTTANRLYNPIATGQTGITTAGDFGDVYKRAQGMSSAETNLGDMASGKWLREGNPYFNARLEGQLDDTAAQTRSLMSGMGRGGGGLETRMLTDRLGNLRTDALAQDWDRNLMAQLQATGQIDAARQAGLGTQLGALSGQTGAESADIQNRLAAAGGLVGAQTNMAGLTKGIADSRTGVLTGNADRALDAGVARATYSAGDLDRSLAGRTASGNLLSQAGQQYSTGLNQGLSATNAMRDIDQRNYENRLAGAEATIKAGGALDEQSQRLLNDEIAKYYAADNADWNRLGLLQSAAAGSAGPYGTQVATSRQPVGMGSVLGGMGSLASGIGSLMGKSDIRAKENIMLVGHFNGLPIFDFNYRGQEGRFRGTMAQALPLHKADALYIDPADGLYGVNYAKLGFAMERVN